MSKIFLEGLAEIYTAQGRNALHDCTAVRRISDGGVLVENGAITRVGPRGEVGTDLPPDTVRMDMENRVAIPCFVDPHTHLVWGGERSEEFNQRLHGASYVEIAAAGGGIQSTVRQTRATDRNHLHDKARKTLDTMLLHGTGTIEAKSGYGLNLETELKQLDVIEQLNAEHPMDVHPTFMGAHEVAPEFKGRPADYIDFLNRELLPVVQKRGTVRYVDIFCEKNVFELEDSRRHLEAARDLGFQLRVHADELYPLGGAGLAAELGAVSADHLIHADPADMKKMARAGTMATLLPGTSFFLRTSYANAHAFQRAGCALALSTDFNPGSSHTISQPLMMALACMNMGLTFEESFVGVTLNAAASLGLADQIGTIEVGKRADIAFLDAPSALHLVYFWGINHVTDVMKGGRFAVRNRTRC